MKKKILVVTSTFPRNDTDVSSARFVFDLARAMSEHYEVHVLTPHSHESRRFETIDGIKVHRFRYFLPESMQRLTHGAGIMANIKKNKVLILQLPFLFISEIYNIVRIVKKEKIDIINSHWIVPQGMAVALVKKTLNVKHVMTIHAAGIFSLRRWGSLGRRLASYIVRRTDLVLPVSSYIKSVLDGLIGFQYRCRILPMGFASKFNTDQDGISQTAKSSEGGLKLLFVGKLVEKKGLIYLLNAVNLLRDKKVSIKLKVVGGGPLEKELKEYVFSRSLSTSVSFCGWIPNEKLPEFYNWADISVVPSVYDKKGETEGMPVVVLESMAVGIPVLASEISGIPDIVEDGINGWLVEYGSGQVLADKMEEISGMDLEQFSKSAIKTSARYTYEAIASGYVKEIENLCEN